MHTEQAEQPLLHISQEKLLAFVHAMMGEGNGREDDEHPLPPGPWDPVIRVALEQIDAFSPRPEPWKLAGPGVPWRRIASVFGPRPEPWKVVFARIVAKHPEIWDVIGGGDKFREKVALNPQPLPPRFAFLVAVAQAVINRAELLQEVADATAREDDQQGIIIVGGYTSRFSDDFCGTGFRLKYPFPGPPPHWFTNDLDGIDLLVIATQFEQASKEMFSPGLRQNLAEVSAKFVEAGVAKMQ
jgi:hypothetical protein